jgi:hypothetical protein
MLSSQQRELEALFEALDCPEATVTASALSQARAKLRHTAFIELNEHAVGHFYRHSPEVRRWRGYVVSAVDGSTVALPRVPALEQAFGGMKPRKGDFRPKARVLERYDVLNHVVLEALIAPYKQGERTLLKAHEQWDMQGVMGVPPSQVITLYDRGFAALKLLAKHAQEGTPFVLRLPSRWWKVARSFVQSGAAEEFFELQVRQRRYTLRLVRVETHDPQQPAVLVTNLSDISAFPAECFAQLYALRWGIEGGYKLLKCRAQLEHWSAKTEEGIRQDFHAKVMALSLSSVLSAGSDAHTRQRTAQQVQRGNAKHKAQINRTHALGAVRRLLPMLLLKGARCCAKALAQLNACFQRVLSLIRPNRSSPRPYHSKPMPPTAYKPL